MRGEWDFCRPSNKDQQLTCPELIPASHLLPCAEKDTSPLYLRCKHTSRVESSILGWGWRRRALPSRSPLWPTTAPPTIGANNCMAQPGPPSPPPLHKSSASTHRSLSIQEQTCRVQPTAQPTAKKRKGGQFAHNISKFRTHGQSQPPHQSQVG